MQGRSELGRLETTVYCQNCDAFTVGVPVNGTTNRCTECGRFTSAEPNVCCTQHEVKDSPYASDTCPYCEQERNRRAQQMHEMTRDPTLEPY